MPIQSGDVKLVKSAVMADVPEGGGAPTGLVIEDGVSNAIFPDISELDRAGGRVNLRKVFVSVQTDDTDTYFGGNVIVAEPPQDPRVSVTLFTNGLMFDPRTEASGRIEAYLNKGPEWGGFLYENHIKGQRVIQLFQRPNSEIPVVGQTLVLVEFEGKDTEKSQYIRATSVSVVERTFTYDVDKDYKAWIVTLELSDTLRYDFKGSPASRLFARTTDGETKTTLNTLIRDTVVADAGTYVGVVPLTKPAGLGDFTVKGSGIYTQLVPSAQTETPISFAQPYTSSAMPVPGVAPISFASPLTWNTSTNLQLPGGCLPGSLSIVTDGVTISDSAGLLKTATSEVGTIDYANGILSVNSGSFSNSKAITYTPAAQILRAPQSTEFPITAETRSLSYTGVVVPTAQPGTLSFSYLAQGRWYVLSEQGDGTIRGIDSSFGVGTYNKDTGAFVVTLGALPDVGSSIIITWNVPTQETPQPLKSLTATCYVGIATPDGEAIQPGSLTASWEYAGTKSTTAATDGTLSGDATGVLRVASGILEFAPKVLPAVGTIVTLNYTSGPKHTDTLSHPSRDGNAKVPAAASLGSIQPGSLEVEWNTLTDLAVLGTYTREQLVSMGIFPVDPVPVARDDALGNLKLNGETIGTVNYDTGAVLFNPDVTIKIPRPIYSPVVAGTVGAGAGQGWSTPGTSFFRLNYRGVEYVDAPSLYPNDESGYVKLRYNSAGSTSNHTQQFQFQPSFKLVPDVNAQIVPGSVLLAAVSALAPWGDSGQGVLREPTSSGWLNRGTINYVTGDVTLTSWNVGANNNIIRHSTTTSVGETITSEFVFRTAASPLRPGSLSITFSKAPGGTVNVNAGTDGLISATGVSGTVDYENGVVRLRFGSFVTAAGNENEPWFNESAVGADGKIFKPAPIAMSTLRYNAVSYSYLPLDADLLGIDPVRLPSDGRVPIFRPGGFAVVGHTGKITTTVSNGQTIDCARVRLSRVRVVGDDGAVINTGFTTDLDAGTVTFSDVSGYSQPVTIQHRIEDMGVVREASINGEVTFTRPLTHDYPNGSYVSSALIAADLFARVSLVFDQSTWNGTFSDAQGAPATATFNATSFPITVTNRGALTERWVVRFTNSTSFEVIGENVGVIATGNTTTNCSPINPNTDAPYFTIPALGWGAGWATGNILRFNTIGAIFPVWVVRTVQQGPETITDDKFTLLVRGDVNTP